MADYTLSDGDDITISSNTTVDDFHFRGGKIRVKPNVALFIAGDFIFDPQTSEDPLGKIYNAFVTRASVETGYNGAFTGFNIYDIMPDLSPLIFPAIVFDPGESEERITAPFFGGESMESVEMLCDLAFKMDRYIWLDGSRVGKKELAEHYLWYMRQVLNDMKFTSDYIKIGKVDLDFAVQEPMSPQQTLYGFTMEIHVDFKKEPDAI